MDTVLEVLEEKGRNVHSTKPTVTVLEAVEVMCKARVGALLVCDDSEPVGMITERDLMTRVILLRRDPATTLVSQVMTTELVTIPPHMKTTDVMALMTRARCRHLPVMDGRKLIGMISIGDVVRWHSRVQDYQIRTLTDFVEGRYPG